MARENTTEMAVLGLLALGAKTGYDVRQACEEQLGHFWSESFGQIYPVLRRLHDRGWVEVDPAEGGGGGRRREHEITAEGLEALRAWIVTPPQPMRVRNELLLKLFLGRLVDRDGLRGLLRRHEDDARARREGLLSLRSIVAAEADPVDAPLWMVTIDYGVRALDAQAEWAREALAALSDADVPEVEP